MLLFILALIFPTSALEVRGTARSLEDNSVLYTEVHKITVDDRGLNRKIVTQYLKPDGKVFAKMTSDFSKSDTIPIVSFEDYRFQKKEKIEFEEKEKTWRFFTALGNQESKAKDFTVSKDLVAGQGFDNFIKINFEKLNKNEVPLKFGVLSEMDFYSFRGYKKSSEAGKTVKFGIQLDNIFLRLFADELLVEYDVDSKRLKSYKGLSNIVKDDGGSQNVLISYESAQP
jgi:hypothetical protein